MRTTTSTSYFGTGRVLALLLVVLLAIILLILNKNSRLHTLLPNLTTALNKYSDSFLSDYSFNKCLWQFDHYSPSTWEMYWYNNITYLQNHVCSTLTQMDQRNKSIQALEQIIHLQNTISNRTLISNQSNGLFSRMVYCLKCSLSSPFKVLASQHIEPLIGLLRDPLTICSYPNLPTSFQPDYVNSVQSKRFFLLGPSAPYEYYKGKEAAIAPWLYQPGSKKILFDLGATYFNGWDSLLPGGPMVSTRWFYDYFRNNSIHFDRIIAFEAAQYAPKTYWNQIPDDIIGLFTFINVGIEKTGKYNPWNILKSIATKGDYVVIKLDVDTPILENDLTQQILNDSSISSLIDEMFFEMHVTINEMKAYWGIQPGELKDTYELFTKLRQLGIRMHSWP